MKYPSMSISVPSDPGHPGHLRTDDAPPPYIPDPQPASDRSRPVSVYEMSRMIASIRAGNIADMRSRGPGKGRTVKGQSPRDPRRGLLSRDIGRRYIDMLDCDYVGDLTGQEGVGEGGW